MSTLRTPAECLSAEVEHNGRRWMLCLVRTFDLNEGSCILEVRNAQGTDSEAVEPNGQWRLKGGDEGPAALSVEIELGGVEDLTEDSDALMDSLLSELVKLGGVWGLEAFAPWGLS